MAVGTEWTVRGKGNAGHPHSHCSQTTNIGKVTDSHTPRKLPELSGQAELVACHVFRSWEKSRPHLPDPSSNSPRQSWASTTSDEWEMRAGVLNWRCDQPRVSSHGGRRPLRPPSLLLDFCQVNFLRDHLCRGEHLSRDHNLYKPTSHLQESRLVAIHEPTNPISAAI
jgi:hypothetical protein